MVYRNFNIVSNTLLSQIHAFTPIVLTVPMLVSVMVLLIEGLKVPFPAASDQVSVCPAPPRYKECVLFYVLRSKEYAAVEWVRPPGDADILLTIQIGMVFSGDSGRYVSAQS